VNEVAFIWDGSALEGLGALRVEVDGRDLAEAVGDIELPYAEAEGHPQIAGSYVGLRPWQLSGSLTDHFMGAAGSDLACGPREMTVLLGCECGEPGCWPLMADVSVGEDAVTWRAFEQPHRRARWSYERLGRLTFARSQYEAALAKAESRAPEAPPNS
jgi:hypothetical protein